MTHRSHRSRVLLVDVDDASRHALESYLADAGYDVFTASSGRRAISYCELQQPDVVIMEVRLPDMDGFEVCERIRHEARDLDVHIVIMTEPTDEFTRAYLGSMVDFAGGDYYLFKPCDGKLIVQLLDDLTADRDEPGSAAPDSRRRRRREQSLALT